MCIRDSFLSGSVQDSQGSAGSPASLRHRKPESCCPPQTEILHACSPCVPSFISCDGLFLHFPDYHIHIRRIYGLRLLSPDIYPFEAQPFHIPEKQTFAAHFFHAEMCIRDRFKGPYPADCNRDWEDMRSMRNRILPVLEKYKQYPKIIVACHGDVYKRQLFPGI